MKIGILARNLISDVNYKVLNRILQNPEFQIKFALIDCRPSLSAKEKLLKNLKKGRGLYILIMFFNKYFSKKEIKYSVTDFCKSGNIEVIQTKSPYSTETISKVKEFNPDVLILINGFGIIKSELLDITPHGILSYHHGDMRKYRGMPPAFWELYNNEDVIGITVQKLKPGLDKGIPIAEKSLPIARNDNLRSLRDKLYNAGIDMMYTALVNLSDPEFKPSEIVPYGKIYTLPDFHQWVYLTLKLIRKRLIS